MQTVRLRFNAVAARWARENLACHPNFNEHEDGSLTLTFAVNHLAEVKRWVLSFGCDCEVLGPGSYGSDSDSEIANMFVR